MPEEQKEQKEQQKRRVRGKDKKPRKTEGLQKNLVKARANSPIMQDQKAEQAEGYNSKLIGFMLAIQPTEKLDINDVDEMERRFQHYLEMCVAYDVKVGNQGAYVAIGITKQQAWEWENVRFKANPRRADFIKRVRMFCGMYRENLMQDGKVNPVTGIFWQKNYDGLKDQQEVVLTPNNPLGEQKDTESLKQKYLEDTYGVTEGTESPESTERVIDIPESPEGTEGDSSEVQKAQKGQKEQKD